MNRSVLCYFINVDWYFSMHWLERARHCAQAGYEVHLVCRFTDEKIRLRLEDEGIICHNIHLERRSLNPISLIRSYFEAKKALRHIHPDILHCITVKANIVGGLIARWEPLRTVFSVTGMGIAFSNSSLKAGFAKYVTISLYKLALYGKHFKVLFENQSDCQRFIALGLGDESTNQVIAGAGVDGSAFFYQSPIDNDPVRLLFAARMLWDKGLEDAIVASEILKQQGYRVQLDVAGLIDDDTHTAIPEKTLLCWHREGRINWLGAVRDMPRQIHNSAIVLLPTCYGEGIPRVLIEAAACGRPSVATDVPGCRDIVVDGETGFLVQVHSPQQLAEKIEVLLRDQPLRLSMGKKARFLVESTFEQHIVISQTMEVYRSLCLGAPGES